MNATAENPREVIGGNSLPTDAITLAKDPIDAARQFLKQNSVLSTEDEARDAKAILDRLSAALKAVEAERDGKVRPLNEQVKEINAGYLPLHNPGNKNKPGSADKLVAGLLSLLTTYAKAEERRRFEAEEKARREAEEAIEAARRAAEAEEQAHEMAAAGVCDIDMAEVIEEAHTTSQLAKRAMFTARRAEGQTKVRITGGSANAISLKDHEILTVTDWKAAIEEMCDDDGNPPTDIAEAIIKCARAYRKDCKHLPSGVTANFSRGL